MVKNVAKITGAFNKNESSESNLKHYSTQCATEVSKHKKTLYRFGQSYHILIHKL